MSKAPWPFSDERDGKLVPNLPSPEGAELGAHVARVCDGREAKLLARGERPPTRCVDCAFRAGTVPNQCASTLMDAIKCLAEGHEFRCHHGVPDDEEPTRLCAGYVILSRKP